MKAVVINKFGGPEVMEYVDIPKPIPEKGQVLVKNVVAGVGKPDFLVRTGIYPYLEKQPPMLILGNECAGYVEAIGEGVTRFKVGDPVWIIHTPGYGAYAEYISVDENYVTKLPEDIKPEEAPGLLNFFVAYALLNDAGRGTDGKSLYILGGAGGVGTALIKIALAEGWEVISAADTEEKCDHLRKLGTTYVFHSKEMDEYEAIQTFTQRRGVDLVFDQWVGKDFFQRLRLLAPFGMLLVYNWLEGTPDEDLFPYLTGNAINSYAVRSFSFHIYDDKPERLNAIKQKVFHLLKTGRISMEHYFQSPLLIEDAKKAHEMLDEGTIIGKQILRIT